MTEQTGDVLADIDAALEGWHGRDAISPDAMRWAPEQPLVSPQSASHANLAVLVAHELWNRERSVATQMVLDHWRRFVAERGARPSPGSEPKVFADTFPVEDHHGHIVVQVVGRVVPADPPNG